MMDLSPIGRTGGRIAQPEQKRTEEAGTGFGDLLAAARVQAAQGYGVTAAPSGSPLSPGDEAACEQVRRSYSALVEGTEAEYGHLPHDDLDRIMAMGELARAEGAAGAAGGDRSTLRVIPARMMGICCAVSDRGATVTFSSGEGWSAADLAEEELRFIRGFVEDVARSAGYSMAGKPVAVIPPQVCRRMAEDPAFNSLISGRVDRWLDAHRWTSRWLGVDLDGRLAELELKV